MIDSANDPVGDDRIFFIVVPDDLLIFCLRKSMPNYLENVFRRPIIDNRGAAEADSAEKKS